MPQFTSAMVAASLFAGLARSQAISFCTDEVCNDCPVAPGQAVGYPLCNIYDSKTVIGDYGFETAAGGWITYVDVPQPDEGCTVIVRSPAYADVQNCGTPVGLFKNAGCAILPIQQTFMLQFCCGDGDCSDAGANGKMVRGVDRNMIPRSGSSGYQFKYANGTVIEPLYSGPPMVSTVDPPVARSVLAKRACTWRNEGDVFTKNADNFQVVANGVNGGTDGGSIEISVERSISVSSSFSIGIADILSLGVEVAVEETTTSSETVTVNVAPNAVGIMTFTALLRCQGGYKTCDGEEERGEVCGGFKRGNDVAGTYSVASGTRRVQELSNN